MRTKIEIETRKTFYRIHINRIWARYHLWRYYKRNEAQGHCWLIWSVNLGFINIDCYALNNKSECKRILRAAK